MRKCQNQRAGIIEDQLVTLIQSKILQRKTTVKTNKVGVLYKELFHALRKSLESKVLKINQPLLEYFHNLILFRKELRPFLGDHPLSF